VLIYNESYHGSDAITHFPTLEMCTFMKIKKKLNPSKWYR